MGIAVLGPFRLIERLGEGAMGEVWRAVHHGQGIEVAIKVITAALAEQERYHHRFRREVEAMAGLVHPGVVRPLDYGVVDAHAAAAVGRLHAGSPWVAMELARGGSLAEGELEEWVELRDVLLQILDALAHAHARGIIHRDLKPANVLVAEQARAGRRVMLTDFGISHPMEDAAIKATGQIEARVAGTPAYMAPEQFEGRWRDYGPPTDLYALGCMTWELACGHVPFLGTSVVDLFQQHAHREVPRLAPQMLVPPGLEGWIGRLMQKHPAGRFQCAADAAFALRELDDAPALGVAPLPAPLKGPPPRTVADLDDPDTLGSAPTMTVAEASAPPLLRSSIDVVWSSTTARPWDAAPMPEHWASTAAPAGGANLEGVGLGLFRFREVPFIGRELERDRAWHRLAQVRQSGRAAALLIEGESGRGCSRLAEWIARRALEVGAASLWRAVHGPQAGPGQGLGRMLEVALRCTGLNRSRVHARVLDHLTWRGVAPGFAASLAASITELLRPADPGAADDGVPRVRFEDQRERFAALVRLLRIEGRDRPLIVWLDDVQWAAEGLALARFVLEDEEPTPVLFVLTSRAELLVDRPLERVALEALRRRAEVEPLPLGPMLSGEQREFLRQLLRLEPDLEDEVAARVAGNPLFAVQLISDWIERGLLLPTRAGFALKRGAPRELPAGLFALWEARLHAALACCERPDEARVALELAAALGDPVDPAEWRAVCALAALPLSPAALDVQVSRGLLREHDGAFAFSHGLLRETLESTSRQAGRWKTWQLTCADLLATIPPPLPPGLHERRALHLLAADHSDEAMDPLLHAAREHLRAGRPARASHALDLLQAAMLQAAERASPSFGVEAMILRARLHFDLGNFHDARISAETALAYARRASLPASELRALLQLGLCARAAGENDRAASLLRNALAVSDEIGDPAEAGGVLLELARVTADLGRRDEATALLVEARRRCQAAGDVLQEAHCLWLAAELLNGADQHDEARRFGLAALQVFERVGARLGQCFALNMLAETDRLAGRLTAARAGYERALRLAEETGQTHGVRYLRLNLGLIDLQESHFDVAQRTFLELLPAFQATGQLAAVATLHAALLPCAAHADDPLALDAHFNALSDHLSQHRLVHYDLAVTTEQAADLLARHGDAERAERALCIALGQWTALGNTHRARVVEARLG